MKRFLLLIFMLTLIITGRATASDKLEVAVSIAPQKYFVEKIGGSYVSVNVVVPRGASPATYEPKPSQMASLSRCSLWFAIGVPFEKSQMKNIVSNIADIKIVHTEKSVKRYSMIKGKGGKNYDPHIWLSPPDVMLQARTITQELCKIDKSHSSVYMDNFIRFVAELADLDRAITETLRDTKKDSFITFHPSWGYFARAYGLRQITIEVEGKEPSPMELAKVIEEAKREGLSTIFVQPQFSKASAKTLAKSIGGEVRELDPLAPDWDYNLRKTAKLLRETLN